MKSLLFTVAAVALFSVHSVAAEEAPLRLRTETNVSNKGERACDLTFVLKSATPVKVLGATINGKEVKGIKPGSGPFAILAMIGQFIAVGEFPITVTMDGPLIMGRLEYDCRDLVEVTITTDVNTWTYHP